MAPLPLLAAVAVMAIFGWGFLGKWFKPKPQPLDKGRMEQELKRSGVMKENGTVSVDREFDAELNSIIREMDAIEKDGGAELNEIEKLP